MSFIEGRRGFDFGMQHLSGRDRNAAAGDIAVDHGEGAGRVAGTLPPLTIAMLNVGEGGAQRAMVNFANHLAAQGRAIRILAGERKGTYLDHLNPSITVIQMGPGFARMVRTMIRELRSGPAPAILATQIKPVLASAIAKMITRTRTRLVFRPPNRLTVKAVNFRHAVAKKVIPFLYRRGDAFIAVSGAIAEDLVGMGINHAVIATIPNGVDMAAIARRSRAAIDDPWFAPGAPPVVLAMGRLTRQKGFDVLLRAMARVINARPEVRLMILGEGELRGELETLAKSLGIDQSVRMPGFVENPYAYLAFARLFVLSSRWEGSPNALLEALACGCSVIATDCPSGPREILTRHEIGRLVPVDNVEELVSSMMEMLDEVPDPDRQKAFVAEQFGIDQWVQRYVGVLSKRA